MNQNLWGPQLWFFLHTISFNYPLEPKNEDKEKMVSFLYGLQAVIPCKICRDHFKRNLAESPPKLDSRKDFAEWMIDAHNEVNGRTGKKILTYDEAIGIWEQKIGKRINLTSNNIDTCDCKYNVKDIYLYFLIFLILVIIICYYKQKM
jgi:hypothetical protein